MQFRLRNELRELGRNPDELDVSSASRMSRTSCRRTTPACANASMRCSLRAACIVHRNAEVTEVFAGRLRTNSGESLAADEIVWVTRAGGAPWLR